NTIYAGGGAKLWVTTNVTDTVNGVGGSWVDRSAGLPKLALTHIAVDPIDPATAYVTYSGFPANGRHIFKTTNNGATWADATGNLPNIPVNDLVIDPDLPSTLYIGTDAGVLVSTDDGATWSSLGNGLPNVELI